MVVPPWYEIPPLGYGGLEQVCAGLVDSLVTRGHDVTLFAAGKRTGTRARFVSTVDDLQFPRLGEALPELVHVAKVNQLIGRGSFDVVHDHTMIGPLTAAQRHVPTVVTVHGPPHGDYGAYLQHVDGDVSLVAISDAQRRSAPDLVWAATVHNGLNFTGPVKTAPGRGPVLWLARFSPDKGPDLAIQACRAAGLPLVLAGKCNEPTERRYLDEVVRPLLGPDVRLVINADRPTVSQLLADARCLLLPIRWAEPFGMVMLEAMATGTPVVALNRGAVPELVVPGETGLVCADPAELPEALERVVDIDPSACVRHARTSFSADLMARRYEAVFRRVTREPIRRIATGGTTHPAPAHLAVPPSQSRF
jgi:glycosyltransferase involved in cell wall biosynthesis